MGEDKRGGRGGRGGSEGVNATTHVYVHVGRSLSLFHSLSSLLSCFYLPVFFSLTYTSSIMAPSGLLFQSSIMNSSSGSPVPPRTVSLDQLNKIKQVNLAHN